MELNSLLSNFEKQLHISGHEQNTLYGFLRFLNNRGNSGNEFIPYGLLIQYDEPSSYQVFLNILESILPQLSTKTRYQLKHATEKTLSQISLTAHMKKPGEILVLTDCAEEGSLDNLISQFEASPEIIKIVCVSSNVVEKRFRSNEHFFYRILARHIHLEKLHSREITNQFLQRFREKGYIAAPDFSEELAYYIESIYETADYQNNEFLLDLMRRIELQMEETNGIAAYRNGLPVDIAFIPYSKRVLSRKQSELQALKDSVKTLPAIETPPKSPDFPLPALENEAEIHIQSHQFTSERQHTNVLLLALSTLRKNIGKSEFKYNFNGCQGTVIGRYQLDPIPKMLDELLAQTNENLDKIIMLCTDKTLEKVTVTTPESATITISPLEYFKAQVRNYMNPDLDDKERFLPVNISQSSPYEGIQKVINILRSIHNPVLYLDTHGGIRGIQRIMEATVSLLKIEGINIKEAYSVEFSEESKESIITSETENMKIFDFVAGINEFISCGRANTLMEYSDSCRSQEKTSERDFINAIQNVANGIQWCCIPEFENGLKNLQKFFATPAAKTTNKNTSYLEIYKQDIKQDYKKLVEQHTVADEINWCISKGFYQQALTLIESKVSSLLVDDWKVLEVNPLYPPITQGQASSYIVNSAYASATLNDLFNAFVYPMTTEILNNGTRGFFLPRELFNQLTDHDYQNFLSAIQTSPRFPVSPEDISTYLNNTLRKSTVSLRMNGQGFTGKVAVPEPFIFFDSLDKAILFQLLILHKALKDVRNTMNHASSELSYELNAIVLALKYYMIWLEKLNPAK